MVRVSDPGSCETLTFMLRFLPHKVGIVIEGLGQFSNRRRTVERCFARLPLGTCRWKFSPSISSIQIYQPEQAKLEETVCTGLEPLTTFKVVNCLLSVKV